MNSNRKLVRAPSSHGPMAATMRNATLSNVRPLQPCCGAEKQSRSTPGNNDAAPTCDACDSPPHCLFNTDCCLIAVRPWKTPFVLYSNPFSLLSLLLHLLSVISRRALYFSDSDSLPFFACCKKRAGPADSLPLSDSHWGRPAHPGT